MSVVRITHIASVTRPHSASVRLLIERRTRARAAGCGASSGQAFGSKSLAFSSTEASAPRIAAARRAAIETRLDLGTGGKILSIRMHVRMKMSFSENNFTSILLGVRGI